MNASPQSHQKELIPTSIFDSVEEAAQTIANEIESLIKEKAAAGKATVLGLATGSTPVPLYQELIRRHREDGLSFSNVVTFNLDEYHGLAKEHPESYWRFMHEQLFDHVDIPSRNIHVPDGLVDRNEAFGYCQSYEQSIVDAGGLDLQILGIGRTGHIGFNEPGSGPDSRTRMVTLDSLTIRDAAADFQGERNVPRHALTMGVGTILAAKRVVLMAWGQDKASVVAKAVEDKQTESLPASFLQSHSNATFCINRSAALNLTRIDHPWLVGPVNWCPNSARKAVTWLSLKTQKPILKLLDEEYSENGMADLITQRGDAYQLNIEVFNDIQHTITGWPGGKPDADDSHRPERALPRQKNVLILSPEPDNDLLGMGGTLRRLIKQQHSVSVAYLTSGNLSVPDNDAQTMAEFTQELDPTSSSSLAQAALQHLKAKSEFDEDSLEIRALKSYLRRVETRAALNRAGLSPDNIHFLDLPFYEKGKPRQFRYTDDDRDQLAQHLKTAKPHQIYITGREADPSSLPAVTFRLFTEALAACRAESWRSDCRVWLYRLPERDWKLEEIDMAVPFSPRELTDKIQAIFYHKTQRAQSPGGDTSLRERWQQAEKANQALAATYDALGFAEYEAIEAFSRLKTD